MRVVAFAACVVAVSASLPKPQDNFLAQQAAIVAVREAEDGATVGVPQMEAVAVGAAATEAIKRSSADVTPRILEKAASKAERTYAKLIAAGVDQKTAAEQAAEVAVAVVDAVADKDLSMEVVQDVEVAAVVATKAIDDHPTSAAGAEAQARSGASVVITAEDVAANAARSAVMTAEDAGQGQGKEAMEGIAAADAAINAVEVGDAVPAEQAKRAEEEAASVFESLVDKQVPEHIAARDAAQTAVNDVDPSAPALVKQAAEAASEAAADALSTQDDATKAADMASEAAAKTVFDEKVAAMAAVKAVTSEEGAAVSSTESVEDRQASAAAEAAVSAVETAADVPEAVAEKAETDAVAAYKGVSDGGDASTKDAAKKAVEVVMADVKSVAAETGAVAAAAAAAAAEAVGENPKDEALALQEASKDASSAVSVAELVSEADQVSTGGGPSPLAMLSVLGLAYAAYHMYSKPKDQADPYADPYLEGFKPMGNDLNLELRDRP